MKFIPLIALGAFVVTTQLHAEVGPKIPRASFLCAEMLVEPIGDPVTKDNVDAEFAVARARLSSLVENPRAGRWAKFRAWFDVYNPYMYGGFTLRVDKHVSADATPSKPKPAPAPVAADSAAPSPLAAPETDVVHPPTAEQRLMAAAALDRLDHLERAVKAHFVEPKADQVATKTDASTTEAATSVATAAPTVAVDGHRALVGVLNARSEQLKQPRAESTVAAAVATNGVRPKLRPVAASDSRLLASRVITGRPAIWEALKALRAGVIERENAHPGYVETPAPEYTAEEAAAVRVGRFRGDALRSMFYGVGSLVSAGAAAVLTNGLYLSSAQSPGQVAAIAGLAAVSAVQMAFFVENAGYLKTSYKTFVANLDRMRENTLRRDHEQYVLRDPLDQINTMLQMLEYPARNHKAVLWQTLKVRLPINAPEWSRSRLPISSSMIERFERSPSPMDWSVSRSVTIDFLFVYDDDGDPTLKFFVNEDEIDPATSASMMSGTWTSGYPF